jgi:glutamyl/glutaminyl-tRNA synthetase
LLAVYFDFPDYETNILFWKDEDRDTKNILSKLSDAIDAVPEAEFDLKNVTEKLMATVPPDKKGDYLWPLRVSLSGSKTSPTPFELAAGLGKKESIRRIDLAIKKLDSRNAASR